MMASGRIVPNLMDVAFSALNDLRHTDAHRVSLSRVRGRSLDQGYGQAEG